MNLIGNVPTTGPFVSVQRAQSSEPAGRSSLVYELSSLRDNFGVDLFARAAPPAAVLVFESNERHDLLLHGIREVLTEARDQPSSHVWAQMPFDDLRRVRLDQAAGGLVASW